MTAPLPLFTLTLTVGSTDYSTVVSQAEFVPSANVLTAETFGGPKQAVGRTKWAMTIGGFQDYHDATSLARYLFTNNGKKGTVSVKFPDDSATPKNVTATATATMVSPGFGGSVNDWAKFSVSLPVDGDPTIGAAV